MTQMGPRIILIGGTYRALFVLERLLERGERIVGFVGQEGGGERDFCPEILEICDRHQIPARSAHKLGEEIVRWLEDRIRPDLALAVGVDMEIPLAVGGNTRLGLIEVVDCFRAESCPGVVLRQRGQDLLAREVPGPDLEGADEGDAYLYMVEEIAELLDEYLDGHRRPTPPTRATLAFDPEPVEGEALEHIIAAPGPGPHTDELEARVADYVAAGRVVALRSYRDAFALLARTLELGPGCEVVCPGVASRSAVDALRLLGATPVFADVEPGALTLDPERARDATSDASRALLISHPFGQPADLGALYALAAEAGIEVIEDAGMGLGARFEGSRLGRSPCTTVFRMPLSRGDAGCDAVFVTLAPALTERFSVSEELRLGDGAAQVALGELERWDDTVSTRRQNAASYSAELCRYDAFRLPPTYDDRLPTYGAFVLGLTRFSRTSADDLHKLLGEAGIESRRLVLPLSDRELIDLPITEQALVSSILLPVAAGTTSTEIDYVLDTVFGYAIG